MNFSRTANFQAWSAWFAYPTERRQNGNGEMTGTHWIKESGFLDGPIMVTNTHSVGVVRDAVIAWQAKHGFVPKTSSVGDGWWSMPVVAET